MKKAKREIGSIYKENGATYKVIGIDGAGKYILTKVSKAEMVEDEIVEEQPRPRRSRTREV
jgi:hypothetical protein